MFIVAHHDIKNTEDFWAAAQRNLPRLPEDCVKRVMSIFPNKTMDKCTCVWEADSIESLESYLREKMGSTSNEFCYQVNEATAVGLFG